MLKEIIGMIATIATNLPCSPARVWQEVQTSKLLIYITWPLVVFQPVAPTSFPDIWANGKYLTRMKLFGLIPFGKHWIVITRPIIDPTPGKQVYEILDNGYSNIISTWRHLITIRETGDGRTLYSDKIEIEAGMLTPVIWIYANLFYRYRQMRWRSLVAHGFDYRR